VEEDVIATVCVVGVVKSVLARLVSITEALRTVVVPGGS
jgi:hypothetical protein